MDYNVTVKIHEALKDVEDRTCLILDDDGPFLQRLARALTQRGFLVSAVSSANEAKDIARMNPPAFAVLDLRLEDGSGLDVVETLHQYRPEARAVVLTGSAKIGRRARHRVVGCDALRMLVTDADARTTASLAQAGMEILNA